MKKVRTNSKEVRNEIKKHILECVYNEFEESFNNINECANYMYSEFQRVANYEYNLKRYPNEQERFSDYLNGLPFNFEYSHYSIGCYLNSLGINPYGKEYDNDQSLKLYHYLIYSEMKKAIKTI